MSTQQGAEQRKEVAIIGRRRRRRHKVVREQQCLCWIRALSHFKAKAKYQLAEVHQDLFICINSSLSLSDWVEIQNSNEDAQTCT